VQHLRTPVAKDDRLDPEVPAEFKISLATLPPTSRQRQIAIFVVAVLLTAFVITAPFADTPLLRIDAFIPTLEAMIFVTDLITQECWFFVMTPGEIPA
jgi:hypothetical protein